MGWKDCTNSVQRAKAYGQHQRIPRTANQQCEGQSGGNQGRGPAGPEDRKRDRVQDLQARAALVTAPWLVTL